MTKSSLHFVAIDEQIMPLFAQLQRLDSVDAVLAAENSRGKIQVVLWYEDNQDPEVGFVFEDGKYVENTLGSERTQPLLDAVAQHRGQPVSDSKEVWLSFFDPLDNG